MKDINGEVVELLDEGEFGYGDEVKCNQCDWEGIEGSMPLRLETGENGIQEWYHVCPNCLVDEAMMDVEKEA